MMKPFAPPTQLTRSQFSARISAQTPEQYRTEWLQYIVIQFGIAKLIVTSQC